MTPQQDEMTRLGLFGLTPFFFAAIVMWLSPLIIPSWAALNIHTLALSYAGIIAAYVAGVGAGVGFKSHAPASIIPSVIATLAAWVAIWPGGFLTFSIPAVQRYLILIAVYIWILLRDLRTVDDFPSWYRSLRTRLTFWACISLVLIMARLLTWRQY